MKFLTIENGQIKLKNESASIAISANVAGDFKFHFTHYTGSLSIAEMQQLGWCVLDGTTAESQLVTSGYFTLADLAITGILDNLIAQDFSGRVKSLFVRSGATSGNITEDTLQDFGISTNSTDNSGGLDSGPGAYGVGPVEASKTDNGNGAPRLDDETKPASITAIPLMYCLNS